MTVFYFYIFTAFPSGADTPPVGGGLGVRGRGEAPTPQRLALEAGGTQPALVDGMVRQAAADEALAGTWRLFRGG